MKKSIGEHWEISTTVNTRWAITTTLLAAGGVALMWIAKKYGTDASGLLSTPAKTISYAGAASIVGSCVSAWFAQSTTDEDDDDPPDSRGKHPKPPPTGPRITVDQWITQHAPAKASKTLEPV